tara:strand:+ start:500 stop:631 length:132 start_codon:yes stop_codon:yes gene_type:complete
MDLVDGDLVDQEEDQAEDHEEGFSDSVVGSALVSKVNKLTTRT